MERWGIVTWVGVLLAVLLLLVYYKGAQADVGAFSDAFGNTVKSFVIPNGVAPQYA